MSDYVFVKAFDPDMPRMPIRKDVLFGGTVGPCLGFDYCDELPSAADLDAVAEEQRIKELTSVKTDSSQA